MRQFTEIELKLKLVEILKAMPPSTIVFKVEGESYTSSQIQEEIINSSALGVYFISYTFSSSAELLRMAGL